MGSHASVPLPADSLTALGTGEQLLADLESISTSRSSESPVLAAFGLTGLERYERRHGSRAKNELLAELAGRLRDAIGRGASAYRIGETQFAVLARPPRGGSRVITVAAAAALSDDRHGIAALAGASIAPIELIAPAEALWLLKSSIADRHMTARRLRREPATASEPELAATAAAAARDRDSTGAATALVGRQSTRASQHPPRPPTKWLSLAQARARRPSPPRNPPPRGGHYLRIATRFRLSMLCGLAWVGFSAWIATPWIEQLAATITLPGAAILIVGIALIPGYLNVQLVSALLMDHPAQLSFDLDYPALTVIVAAFEEEHTIAQTLAYALAQDYPGSLRVLVVDDGSKDATATIARGVSRIDERAYVLEVGHGGKAKALNTALARCQTPLVATIDADTLLMPDALKRIVARMLLSPDDTVAVAGSVLVRDSRRGLLAKVQVWDYLLGIGSIKRQQALLQATLVAQGAFSVYDTSALQAVGGWPDRIGEDIVMTWALLARGGRTTFEPTAVAFTETPATLRALARQRRRWARGMIEGLRSYGWPLIRRHATYSHGVLADAIFPYLDLAFTFAFIPGIALAATGDFAIVGPMTIAVLPINALLAGIMFRRQHSSLLDAGLRVRRGALGFVLFLLIYQLFMSPVSVAGYLQELLHVRRRW